MPDVAVHAVFGREVRAELEHSVEEKIHKEPYTFALFGPDIWFMYQPWKRREGRGREMHTTQTGRFLMALARRAKTSSHPEELFSYLAGFLCHYALDTATHPYIVYMTEIFTKISRGHMSFEHTLDKREMERAGIWGENHPITKHYYPNLRLPECLREDLDAVFEEVYGWKNSWHALNVSWPRYRFAYRLMENPKGLFTKVAKISGHAGLKSLAYATSHYDGMDVENNAKAEWAHSHDDSLRYTSSFSEMKEGAKQNAIEMITAAYRFIFLSELSEEELAERIGSLSYLSGLPVDDPRNTAVTFLLPPKGKEGTKHL